MLKKEQGKRKKERELNSFPTNKNVYKRAFFTTLYIDGNGC